MGTRGGGGGSASRVGDWDVDLGDPWGWGSIPRLLSSACLFFCSGGCFGCCDKTVKKLGELSKTLITHDQLTVGEPFWSTTTIDVSHADLKGFPPIETGPWNLDEHESGSSHRLVITESGKLLLPQSGSSLRLTLPESGSSHGLPGSVNPGRILWEQTREEWTEIKRLRPKVKQVREPVLSWSAAYQNCLVTNKPFPRPVPLYVRYTPSVRDLLLFPTTILCWSQLKQAGRNDIKNQTEGVMLFYFTIQCMACP